jgi:tryptophan 2,3-dioxygenase
MTTEEHGTRPVEKEVVRDFREAMSYGDYLHLDELLSAQHPVSRPEHHDEMLFIIQHQTSELWLKLVLHELRAAMSHLASDDLRQAMKNLARVKHVQRTLIEQWSVLATLTPSEYLEFRGSLASSSGFQSQQYRAVEFALGNKNAAMLEVFRHDEAGQRQLAELLAAPSLYDQFLRYLARQGWPVPQEVLDRDVTKTHVLHDGVVEVFRGVYSQVDQHWGVYEACEDLVDLEDSFQVWRFRHLRTVQRTIGFRRGTGGSSGTGFLARALDLTFFPELYAVRTELGD